MICNACRRVIEDDAVFCGLCGKRTRMRRASVVGSLVDDTYRIDAKIAEGGFGAIYRATHLPSGVVLALKILHADFAADAQLSARFIRESRTLSLLRSPHTVVTYERGEARDGTFYIAMELLHGESLLERFRRLGPLPWREMLAIMRAVCSSLAEAHEMGIVHRDLKPANIHLDGGVKVLDFGVAKLLPWSGVDDGADLTMNGQAVGTLEYMAPEQLSGAPCDARADLYALGVVVYEMITGRRPFAEAVNAPSLITALFTQTPPPPSSIRSVPPQINQLLLRCLERDAGDRYASAMELAAVIDRILGERATPRNQSIAAAAGGGGVQMERRMVIAPTVAYGAMPMATPLRRRSIPAFEVEVRGTAIDAPALPAAAARPATVVPAAAGPSRTWFLWVAGVVLAIAAIAVACLV